MAVPTARERNALRVLDYLFREGPARRVDVIRATGLSRATVSKLIGELQAQELVAEERPALSVAGPGRPPTLLTLNPKLGAFGGVDFGHSSVRVAIADVTGTLLAEDRLDLDVDNAAELAISAAVDRLPALVAEAGLPRRRLLGVGAAISAPVRRDGASLVAAGILPGWSAVSPQRELARRLGVPVHVGNDANLGALAEVRTGAAQGASDVVYVMLSSGVGGGLVLNGSLFTGHSGMTGELGHVQVDPEGDLCRCGNRGCLETFAAARHVLPLLHSAHGTDLTVVRMVELAHAGDPGCRRVIGDVGRHIGSAVASLCNLLNPSRVVLGGELAEAGELVLGPIRESVSRYAIPSAARQLEVVPGALGGRSEVLGALALVLSEMGDSSLLEETRPADAPALA